MPKRHKHPLLSRTLLSGACLPQLLGFSGLLPMLGVLTGILVWPQYSAQLEYVALIYVGSIFAFLGGIQWGLALRPEDSATTNNNFSRRLLVGVLPSLLTVIALLIPFNFGCLMLIFGLWLLFAFERYWGDTATTLPGWYLPLRRNLTLLLSVSLACVLWLSVSS